MAQLHSFRAFRYNRDLVGDLERVVTQPYDKISPELQQDYHRRSPYNAAWITKSMEKNENPQTDYSGTGEHFRSWIGQGVLTQDPKPGIYAYVQDYEIEGESHVRKGFIALLDLKHSAAGILPHERTLAEPKMDRLRLIRSTECNDDLIFMLYTDERLAINRLLEDRMTQGAADIEVRDDYAVLHRIWSITDAATLKKIREAMVPEELFIADGHHRFETSVNFLKECEAKGWKPAAAESFDKRLVACFNSADRGITILPTHRLVRNLPNFKTEQFLDAANQNFEVETLESGDRLWQRMKQAAGAAHVFGFSPGDKRKFYFMELKEEAKVDPLLLAHPEAYRHLDVSILHTLILDGLLGIDESKLEAQSHVEYARDREGCLRRVQEGHYQAAFFLNPTTVEQVQRIALLGERMPQKSTDFYPKLLTGLVFMKMEIEK